MIRALYSAASGMTAQQLNVDNIANNLANANTTGYKMRRAQFQDLLYQNMSQPGASAGQQTTVPTGLQLGLGTRAASNEIIFTQGNFSETDNPLDVVIQGNGFFQMRRATGELAYTRAGNFQLDKNGNMVTANGDPIAAADHHPVRRPVHHHRARMARSATPCPDQTAARTRRADPTRRISESRRAEQHRPEPVSAHGCIRRRRSWRNPGGQEGSGTLLQGYPEQSNVSIVEEFINLIVAQRAYEANSKVVKAADEMYQQVNNLKQ